MKVIVFAALMRAVRKLRVRAVITCFGGLAHRLLPDSEVWYACGMDMQATAIRPATHFDFGRNWADYATLIDENAVYRAGQGLDRLGLTDIRGKSFLDVGCASRIHALAAARRGAHVTAIDVDRESVDTTNQTLRAGGFSPCAEQLSIFEANACILGQFDVVYSWGVLHHTGNIWSALGRTAAFVEPGGTLAIALYERTPLCGLWRLEKRIYKSLPTALRFPIKAAFGCVMLAVKAFRAKQSIAAYLIGYAADRGMSYWHDIDDWLGGYPYEPVSTEETVRYLAGKGFTLARTKRAGGGLGLFGTGCSEFVFHAGT